MSIPSRRKGKMKARGEGPGAAAGIVLDLQIVDDGLFNVAYTLPVVVGQNRQAVSLQIDTGSTDLWIASTACSSSACTSIKAHEYSPDQAVDTGQQFSINYLQGAVSGPIVWDALEVGGYQIANQALAAATSVTSEPLSASFNGILGLAPPLNSKIAQLIPVSDGDSPDGAPFSSNLFGITPTSSAPAARFLSLVLARPDTPANLPSLLGIGRHPQSVVPDPSKIAYTTLLSSSVGTLFWKTTVNAITVYVDGVPKPIDLGKPVSGARTSAVLDSGVPYIFATAQIANGIYGALGIGPGSDGSYYVPCSKPLNMTLSLSTLPPIPLHPLDLTAQPSPNADTCLGLIQALDGTLSDPSTGIGDMILGVAFLRNVYTVLGYDLPNATGVVPSPSTSGTRSNGTTKPVLGLIALTDPTQALAEFHTIRVLHQPLSNSSSSSSGGGTQGKGSKGGVSVGIGVLVGLLSFFGLCVGLFVLRSILARRTLNARRAEERSLKGGGRYILARRGSVAAEEDEMPSEDTLRTLRYQEYVREKERVSGYSADTDQTRVGAFDGPDEFGVGGCKEGEGEWDPGTSLYLKADAERDREGEGEERRPESSALPTLGHTALTSPESGHDPIPSPPPLASSMRSQGSASRPLLSDVIQEDESLAEFGSTGPGAGGMAGVGTAARGSLIDPRLSFTRSSAGSFGPSALVGSGSGSWSELDEFGRSSGSPKGRTRPLRIPSGPRASVGSVGSAGGVGEVGNDGKS